MKKILIIVAVMVVVGVGAAIVFAQGGDAPGTNETTTSNNGNSSGTTSGSSAEKVITAEEVAQRNTSANCWTIINGGVYDLTSYIAQHPSGNDITLACGVDGSSLFNERKANDGSTVGSGGPHSERARAQLQELRIGTIQ